jgi:hypothetical protein
MKTTGWIVALACAGVVLSLKDANWLGNPSPHNLGVLASGTILGAVLGLCIAQIIKPIRQPKDRVHKFVLWILAFAILGLVLGHGNVPWSTTFKIMGSTAAIGAAIGIAHSLMGRQKAPPQT